MSERNDITNKIVSIKSSMARRKRSASRSSDAGYRAVVATGLKIDEQRLERLYAQLSNWS